MPIVMAEVFAALPLPPMRMQVNNRKLIEGFYRGLGVDDVAAVLRTIDKLDKIGPDRVRDAARRRRRHDRRAGRCVPRAGRDLRHRRQRWPTACAPWA